jgi:hypothetical protein
MEIGRHAIALDHEAGARAPARGTLDVDPHHARVDRSGPPPRG